MNKHFVIHAAIGLCIAPLAALTVAAEPGGAPMGAQVGAAPAAGMGSARVAAPMAAPARSVPAVRPAPVYSAPARSGAFYQPHIRAQIPTLSNQQTISRLPNQETSAFPARRLENGGLSTNRAIIQPNISNRATNRIGTIYAPNQLSSADFTRATVDQRNAEANRRANIAILNQRRSDALRRLHASRNGRYYAYGDYFPGGFGYNNGYGGYGYNPYGYYASALSYGFPYTIITNSGYAGYPFYGSNFYGYDQPTPDATDPNATQNAAPAEIAPDAKTGDNNAAQPDSLVQAVQAELARRGYFAGKVDGIVSTDFQTALRRFQTDQQLAPTGLINQASLFALGLN